MITEYTDCTEFMRLIEDQKIKPASVKKYYSSQGIIITSTNAKTVAEDVYTIALGAQEIDIITRLIISESNYEKSTIINAKTKDGTDIGGDILDFFADGFNRIRSSAFKEYYVDQPTKSDGVLAVRMTYKRKLPGKNKLIQEETRHVNIRIQRKNETEVSVDIRQTSSFDAQRALEILEKVVGNSDETGVYLSHVNLETLTDRNKVAFFDQLSAYSFNDYRLKTITGITVKKSSLSDEDDIDAEVIEDDEASGALEGISQAVLNGNGLRSNSFVQNSLEQGYYITTMRYRYICVQEAGEFIVSISSKGKDLRVDIDKSYADDDGRLYIQPFPKFLQDEIIQKFQQAANYIYAELQQQQKQCPILATLNKGTQAIV